MKNYKDRFQREEWTVATKALKAMKRDKKATHFARLIADCLEKSLEKLKPPSTTSSLQLKQHITRTR